MNLQLPEDTKWEDGFSGRVTASFTVREKLLTEEISVPLQIRSLPNGLKRGEDFPMDVVLILNGTRSELDAFRLSDVEAFVDLSGYEAGTHTVPLLLEIKDGVTLSVTAEQPYVTLTLTA